MSLTLHDAYQIVDAGTNALSWQQFLTLWQAAERAGTTLHEWIQEIGRRNDESAEAYRRWLDESGEMGRIAEEGSDTRILRERQQGRLSLRQTNEEMRIENRRSREVGSTHDAIEENMREDPSFWNKPTEEDMPGLEAHQQGHSGSGNTDEAGNPATETTLDPVREIWHKFPNSRTARLKWIYTQILGYSTQNQIYAPSGSAWDQQLRRDVGSANTYNVAMGSIEAGVPTLNLKIPQLIKYRMTSPYSIVASDTAQTNLSEPQWIGFFDSMYQYYHVLKASWKISFTIPAAGAVTINTTNPNYRFYVYWKYANYDDPPTTYAIDTTGKTTAESTPLYLTPDDYDRMGGWNKILVAQNSTHDVTRVISGTYNHGDCGMDIKMMGVDGGSGHGSAAATAEGWVSSKVVAPFPENLCVIIVADNAIICSSTSGINMGIRSEINYTVQFKDLQSKYKYPTEGTTLGATSDVGQYFYRGAAQLNPTVAAAVAAVGTYN